MSKVARSLKIFSKHVSFCEYWNFSSCLLLIFF